ncbi:E3 ubiquitin-protein ligase rnf8-like [Polyergus mexicanus]|uniref:E3 ubiquitin-protein ligase rnf8-like n=1 Tax=Polyergus mexicanus TaxID=615972 RepID=UPI0038B4D6DA
MDTEMGSNMDTSISTDPEELILDYSSPTLIDVIDLTKESPRNKPSHLPSCHGCNENASTSRHITRPSRHSLHRNVLFPIVLGRRENIQIDYLTERTRMDFDIASINEIVNFDNTIEIKDDKAKADKQDKNDKQDVDEYYTFESDNRMPVPLTCPICLETLCSRLKPMTTRCGHLFCENCLKESIQKYKHCPTCKTTTKLRSCIRVYL